MSPAAAASAAVAARACGPSEATRSPRVSGPRLLLSTTSWPASTASRARVLPMFPLPMSPIVVTQTANTGATRRFPLWHGDPVTTAAAAELAELYRDLHAHPEPSFAEHRTAGIAAGRLREL